MFLLFLSGVALTESEVLAALISGLSVFLVWMLKEAKPWLTRWLKSRNTQKKLMREQQAHINEFVIRSMMDTTTTEELLNPGDEVEQRE